MADRSWTSAPQKDLLAFDKADNAVVFELMTKAI
jgi:hypothetical protein